MGIFPPTRSRERPRSGQSVAVTDQPHGPSPTGGASTETGGSPAAQLCVGYLLSHYPAISHTFILREIRALRRLDAGIDVRTFSIHRSAPRDLLAAADRDEFAQTYALRPIALSQLASAHAAALRRTPIRYVRALARALGSGGRTARELLWRLFYFVEAVPIWHAMRDAGVRHVHAHFTVPAADVAMVVAELGDERGAWSWSFSGHGPDIQDADRPGLIAKVRRASRVVCISDFARSQIMTIVEPEQWPKLHVVRCGLDPRSVTASTRAARNGVPLRVLNVGRLIPYKAQHLLLEAIELVRARGHDVTLTIVGDGPDRASLERAAASLVAGGHVAFAGSVGQDEIGAYYESADVFCLSSLCEGIPVVLMEAMAHGVPVIATQIMGIPELVHDGDTGILVPPGRADALADAIIRVAEDPALRRRLAESGIRKVRESYDVDRSAAQLAAIFADAVAGSSPADRSAASR